MKKYGKDMEYFMKLRVRKGSKIRSAKQLSAP
jgi:hypothetical protein